MAGSVITGPASDCAGAVEQVPKPAVIHLHPVVQVEGASDQICLEWDG